MGGRVRLDLNNPEFLRGLAEADPVEASRVLRGLQKLQGMDWAIVQKSKGIRWEKIEQVPAPNGGAVYSLRLSQKYRALAFRDDDFLRLLTLHLDHDSAYKK
ncbi:MAG: hypothetical protein ACKVPX_14860 [Myxococcaceae bacterium]